MRPTLGADAHRGRAASTALRTSAMAWDRDSTARSTNDDAMEGSSTGGTFVDATSKQNALGNRATGAGVLAYDCFVVGDAVWDLLAARRAGMLSVGLLSGGYGEDELLAAGAFRVYRGADELLVAIDELGI